MTEAGPATAAAPGIGCLLDLTRSVNRAKHMTLSGIDRVERAYLRWTLASSAGPRFYLCKLSDGWRLLGRDAAVAIAGFLDGGYETPALDLRARLSLVKPPRARAVETLVRRHSIALAKALTQLPAVLSQHLPEGGVYLNVGHDNLTPEVIEAVRVGGMQPITLMHDVIPLDYPEYARPGGAEKFVPKLRAASASALVLTNSRYTADRVEAALTAEGLPMPRVAPITLGIGRDLMPVKPAAEDIHPAFLQIGTIEPRKNHLLALQIWRRLWDSRDRATTPHFHIVGRRGWENEQVLDLLDRSPMMGVTVFEHSGLDDAGVAKLLTTARALLLPSFVEGFGLPLGEALRSGVPVIAADLPPHREVGGVVPELLDPLDGPAWLAAIDDYARTPSPRRDAQLDRISRWAPPRWVHHFTALEEVLPEVLANDAREA